MNVADSLENSYFWLFVSGGLIQLELQSKRFMNNGRMKLTGNVMFIR